LDKVLLEKLTVAKQIKRFATFCGTQSFIAVVTEGVTGSSPEPGEGGPHTTSLFSKMYFNMILPFTTSKLRKYLSSLPRVDAPPISFFYLIIVIVLDEAYKL
jgi:hypothetical protein